MRINNFILVSTGLVLLAGVGISFLVAKPVSMPLQRDLPVYMGEELIVNRSAAKVVAQPQAKAVPAPVPKIAVPLPIFPPRVSFRVLPQYPAAALEREMEGITVLSVYVGLSGNAEQVAVKASSGASELDASAAAAVSQWQFSPATQGGKAIASWFEVPVRFSLE